MMEELKEKVLQAQSEGDIASLYVLESQVRDSFNEETLIGFYANILDLALERLTNTLETFSKLSMNEVQDFATLRALYEFAVEHYSAGSSHDASALFEVLSGISDDDKFSQAMKTHQNACDAKISFDEFIDEYVEMELTQSSGNFYICYFKKEIK